MRGLATLFLLASALAVTPSYSDEGSKLKGPKGVDYGAQGRSIGPIKPTDTLWRIAAKVRPDNSVSIYQVMQALYDKNPSSFLDQNLNHMRDGAYLQIPTLAEIRAVSASLAKQRSEQDDALWEKKKNGTLTSAEINESQKQVTQARKVDVDEAKQELKKEINTIRTAQGTQLVELQKQFKSSVENVEEILAENNKLKTQLSSISKELEMVRNQLGQDSEIQKQLKELIAKQNEIIEQQKAKKIEEGSGLNLSNILSNPFVLGALMFIPALLVIAAVVMFLKKRNSDHKDPELSDDDEFLPQSPIYHENDEPKEPAIENDPLIPDPVEDNDELSVRLDDDLDQDMLPDDDIIFDDSIDDSFDEDASVLNQDELDDLLNDDSEHMLGATAKPEDDELDAFLQQDFDLTSDNDLDDEFDLDVEQSQVDLSDEIVNADDEIASEGDVNHEMAALSEELAENNIDIDSILDDHNAINTSQEIDLDDQNDLISAVESELIDEDALDDKLDADDIDALLDDAVPEQALTEEPSADQLTDEDELDGTLDVDDIDALLDDAVPEQALVEEPRVDLLIDEDELDDTLDADDIDGLLLDDAVPEQALTEEPSADQLTDEDELADKGELEQLIQEVQDLKQDTQAHISDLPDDISTTKYDENLQESLADLADADQAIDDMNVESIASELVDEAADTNEVDIDAALNQEFHEDSDGLVDAEDNINEFDDPSLKSVDQLLSEIVEEDDYVTSPDWSTAEPEAEVEEVEIDLGDDPLADEDLTDEYDLSIDEEPIQQETVTPSQELEEYPELELDESSVALGSSIEQSSERLADDGAVQSSLAEQDLANSLAKGNELDQLEHDYDDDILIDNELSAGDVLESTDNLFDFSENEGTEKITSEESTVAEGYDNQDDSDKSENLTEFELDEIELDDAAPTEQTIADIESNLADEVDLSELTDDEIDDDFMADLTQTDFDALLNELAEPDEADIADASEFDVDFNALLNEDFQGESEQLVEPEVEALDVDEQQTTTTDEFVDIDSLLEQSDDEALDHEPYDEVDMDVGLSDFNDLLAGDNPTDVDTESGGYSAKLDLARAYIEIDDFDAALQAIEDVIENGPEEVQEEAQSLKAKISE